MTRIFKIDSSMIDAVEYKRKNLFVRFKNGLTYVYRNVPKPVVDNWQKSDSAGEYFHEFIRDKYEFSKLE